MLRVGSECVYLSPLHFDFNVWKAHKNVCLKATAPSAGQSHGCTSMVVVVVIIFSSIFWIFCLKYTASL